MFLLLCFFFSIFAESRPTRLPRLQENKIKTYNGVHKLIQASVDEPQSNYGCEVCLDFFDEALNPLLDILAGQGGIAAACYEICSLLPTQTEQIICGFLCDLVGIQEFVYLLNTYNPEPTTLCMSLDTCPSNPNAAGKINIVTSSPKAGPQGTTFTVSSGYSITTATGLGQTLLIVIPLDGTPPWQYEVDFYTLPPGKYSISGSFTATPQIPYPYFPGNYVITCEVCEGLCGGGHSNEFYIAQANGSFIITK